MSISNTAQLIPEGYWGLGEYANWFCEVLFFWWSWGQGWEWGRSVLAGVSVPWPGIERGPQAAKAWNPNH